MSAFLYTFERELITLNVGDFQFQNGLKFKKVAAKFCRGVPAEELSVIHNGRLVSDYNKLELKDGDVCHANLRLLGGKGGFGSMLRALGAQIEKTTNREACRDLSGRRMRDINDEKKIAEWVSKQADREREKEKQKQERMERKRRMPNHTFDDASYTKHIQHNSERIEDALQQGLKAAGMATSVSSSTATEKTAVKRIHGDEPSSSRGSKKSRMWLEMDDLDSDEDEDKVIASENSSSAVSSSSSTHVEPSTSYDGLNDNNGMDASATTSEGHLNKDKHTKDDKTKDVHGEAEVMQGTCTSKEEEQPDNKCSAEKQDSERLSHEKVNISLEDYASAGELESVGLEQLKEELISRGLKYGGTLQQRAQRLFATKGVPLSQLDPSLFAKSTGSKRPSGKKK